MIKCKNECPEKKYDGCCIECPHKEDCPEMCGNTPDRCGESIVEEGTELQVFEKKYVAVISEITSIVKQKKDLEEQEKKMKEQLQKAMEEHGVKKFESDVLNITYVAATTQNRIDSKKLKEKHPDIFEKYSKTSNKSAYVKVAIK